MCSSTSGAVSAFIGVAITAGVQTFSQQSLRGGGAEPARTTGDEGRSRRHHGNAVCWRRATSVQD
jgi:hypothetical protein